MGKIEAGLSDFYLVNEIQATDRGMIIAIEPQQWHLFGTCSGTQFIQLLQDLAPEMFISSLFSNNPAHRKRKNRR